MELSLLERLLEAEIVDVRIGYEKDAAGVRAAGDSAAQSQALRIEPQQTLNGDLRPAGRYQHEMGLLVGRYVP